MARFTLEIECSNAAFTDEDGCENDQSALREVGRILEALAWKLARHEGQGGQWGALLDGNGNRVGAWDYSPREGN